MIQPSRLIPKHPLAKLFLSFIITIICVKTLATFFYDRAPFCSLRTSQIHCTSECAVNEPIIRTTIPTFEQSVQWLFHQRKAPVDAPFFVDRFGINHTLESNIIWDKPMGSKLCIVDIDTRELGGDGYLLDPAGLDWNVLHYTSSGMLNHYIYALLHGYTYKFIRTQPLEDRAVFWTKISALAETLGDECDMTVSIDADATFMNLDLPFEWLLNRWGTTRNTSLTMARDPDQPQNYDNHNNILLNCGFIVAQNLPRTQEILAAWYSCPDDEIKYPDCSKWKWPWPAEQAAFGEYIRYDFEEPEDIHPIDCNEANGFPEAHQGCEGVFIRHHWSQKDLVHKMLSDSWMDVSMSIFHDRFVNKMQDLVEQKGALVSTESPDALVDSDGERDFAER